MYYRFIISLFIIVLVLFILIGKISANDYNKINEIIIAKYLLFFKIKKYICHIYKKIWRWKFNVEFPKARSPTFLII
jgi:hypothetical protein